MWCKASSLARGGVAHRSNLIATRGISRKRYAQAQVVLHLNPLPRSDHQRHHKQPLHPVACTTDGIYSSTCRHYMCHGCSRLHHRHTGVGSIRPGVGTVISHMHTLTAANSNGVAGRRRQSSRQTLPADSTPMNNRVVKSDGVLGFGGSQRSLSFQPPRPPSLPEKVFVGTVILVLVGMGLLFGGTLRIAMM